MSNKSNKIALLGAMAMMSTTNAYTNAYESLSDDTKYVPNKTKKDPLTKKQKKQREKSKRARKARKR